MESAAPFLTGQFLLAMPGIGDPRFEHAVIAMCGHDPEGAIDAALRLDISDATKVNLKAGYSMQREDISAANAIANATNQALVTTYTASAEITTPMR